MRLPRDQYLREKTRNRTTTRAPAVRGDLLPSITLTLVVAALIATYFRTEVAANVTRYAGQEDILGANKIGEYITGLLENQGSRKGNLVAQGQFKADQVSAPAEGQQAAQEPQIAAVPVSEAQQSLREDRAEVGRSSLRTPDPLSRGSMCSCRRKPRGTRNCSKRSAKKQLLSRWGPPPREKGRPRARNKIVKRSKRNAKKPPPSRWRPPPHEKSWPRTRSNIVRRSKRSASGASYWRANLRLRSGKMKSRRRC